MKIWEYTMGIDLLESFQYSNKFHGPKEIKPGRYRFTSYKGGPFIFYGENLIDHRWIPNLKYKYVFYTDT